MQVEVTRKLMTFIAIVMALGLGLYLVTFQILGTDLAYFPGDYGDARFNMYLLEHAHQFLFGKVTAFWNAPFMYPEEAVISYSDNLLGTAPFYSIFRASGLDVITSFQMWYVLMCALSFIACYFFLRWVFADPYAAILGAWVFAFSLALQSQMTHAQTFPRFPIPIAFWLVMLFEQKLQPRYFTALVLTVVYQFYCAVYLGFLLAVPIGMYLVIIAIRQRQSILDQLRRKGWLAQMGIGSLVGLVCILPLIIPYIMRSGTVEAYKYSDVVKNIPTLASHIYSQAGSLLWDGLSKHGSNLPAWWNHQIFAGGVAFISLLSFWFLSIRNRKQSTSGDRLPTYLPMVVVSLIVFVLYLRFGTYSIYRPFFELPGFGSIRALGRIINIELLFYGFAVSFVASRMLQKWSQLRFAVFALLLSVLVCDNYFHQGRAYRTSKEEASARVERLQSKMSGIPPGSVISYEPNDIEDPVAWYQLDAMLATQAIQLKCLNGYSATSPVGFSFYWDAPKEETRKRWLEQKEQLEMNIKVIH